MDAGWTPTQLYIGVSVIVVLAALALLKLRLYEAPIEPGAESQAAEASAAR